MDFNLSGIMGSLKTAVPGMVLSSVSGHIRGTGGRMI